MERERKHQKEKKKTQRQKKTKRMEMEMVSSGTRGSIRAVKESMVAKEADATVPWYMQPVQSVLYYTLAYTA